MSLRSTPSGLISYIMGMENYGLLRDKSTILVHSRQDRVV